MAPTGTKAELPLTTIAAIAFRPPSVRWLIERIRTVKLEVGVSIFCAGAFVAFAMSYFGLVDDVGQAAATTVFIAAGFWIGGLATARK